MTDAHAIGRFHAAYRVPADAPEARARLDALLESVLEAALDGALARARITHDEEVCVRAVAADARLRLVSTDAELVAQWSASLAEALAAAIAAGEPAAVRYASRRQALLDLALGTAAGDLRRAWAWRQLGFWPEDDPVDGSAAVARLVDALCAEPYAVVSLLASVARRGALPRLAVLLTTSGWQRLARAALAAAGLPDSLLDEPLPSTPATADPAANDLPPAREDEDGAAAARARTLFTGSALATAAAGSGAAVGLSPASRRALAVLAALESDPASLVAAGGDAATAIVAALSAELDAPPPAPGRLVGERRRAATDSRSVLRGTASESERSRPAPGAAREGREAEAERAAERSADRPPLRPADPHEPDGDEPDVVAEERVRAWTEHGGLLFLLPLVVELEPLRTRTLRWTLHRLALVTLPELDDADPAALAFAGLAPDALPPSDDDRPPSDDELAALAAVADSLAARVAVLLEREPEPSLLPSVCARRAEVVAEPGWIELRLALEELDVDVRRAGLDLDPGWLPWLGVVVRFVYA